MVGGAHELHGAAGALDDEVGHVADEVSGEAEVEEHVEDVEDHLDGVLGVEVAVADGGHGGDGPVDGGDVADPQAGLPEVGDGRADPRLVPVRVTVGDQVVEAAGAVHQEQRHLNRNVQASQSKTTMLQSSVATGIASWCVLESRGSQAGVVTDRDEARAADPEVAEADVLLEPGEELLDLAEPPEAEDAEQAVGGALPDLAGDEVGQALERDRRRHVHDEERRQVPALAPPVSQQLAIAPAGKATNILFFRNRDNILHMILKVYILTKTTLENRKNTAQPLQEHPGRSRHRRTELPAA